MSLTEIIRGWSAWILGGTAARERMERRLAICDQCPNKKVLSVRGQEIEGNDPLAIYYCRLCKCPLEIKACDPRAGCPDTPPRWGPEPVKHTA